MTSITVGDNSTVINLEMRFAIYSRAYMTFILSYNAEGNGGTYTLQGRAYLDEETAASGSSAGLWNRDGTNISMHQLVNFLGGTIDLDIITIDPLSGTGTHIVYALK